MQCEYTVPHRSHHSVVKTKCLLACFIVVSNSLLGRTRDSLKMFLTSSKNLKTNFRSKPESRLTSDHPYLLPFRYETTHSQEQLSSYCRKRCQVKHSSSQRQPEKNLRLALSQPLFPVKQSPTWLNNLKSQSPTYFIGCLG